MCMLLCLSVLRCAPQKWEIRKMRTKIGLFEFFACDCNRISHDVCIHIIYLCEQKQQQQDVRDLMRKCYGQFDHVVGVWSANTYAKQTFDLLLYFLDISACFVRLVQLWMTAHLYWAYQWTINIGIRRGSFFSILLLVLPLLLYLTHMIFNS